MCERHKREDDARTPHCLILLLHCSSAYYPGQVIFNCTNTLLGHTISLLLPLCVRQRMCCVHALCKCMLAPGGWAFVPSHLVCCAHSAAGQTLQGRHGQRRLLEDVFEHGIVVEGSLSLSADLGHDLQAGRQAGMNRRRRRRG